MINIIMSVKGILKIIDILYIRSCTFKKFNHKREVTVVPDKWRDACTLHNFDYIECSYI